MVPIMAPTHNAVVVHSVKLDIELAENAASALARSQPDKTPEKIVNDLLERLQKLRLRRELKGLNHWGEFAPNYLQKVLHRHEALRQRKVEEFFRVERATAQARAERMLGDRCEAEDAVAEAFLKLSCGKVDFKHFYRVLRQICLDRIRARKRAAKLFVPQCDYGKQGTASWDPDEDETAVAGPFQDVLASGDPLEILLRREAINEGIREIKAERKHRDVRRLQWWRELLSGHCPVEVAGKRSAQTHR